MNRHGHDSRTFPAWACECVIPLGQELQLVIVGARSYGCHPEVRVCETTWECSLILSTIAKAASNVRRAARPEDFAGFRVAIESTKASNWSFRGSPLAIWAC